MRDGLRWFLVIWVVVSLGVTFSNAQSLFQGGDDPLDLTADDGLVWYRDGNKVVATGNARAIRSGVELRADTLTAHYREGPNGDGNEFHLLFADGNVQIISKNERVFGDRGEYRIDTQNFVLVGDNLRIESNQGAIGGALSRDRSQSPHQDLRSAFRAGPAGSH